MQIEPADKAPSVYQPLGADAPVPKRQQRVENRGRAARKSVLQPLTSRVQGGHTPHQTVRLAMYGVLLVIAVLVGMQAWRSDHAEAVRRADAEIIQVAAEQGALTQRMGTLAITRMAPGLDTEDQYRALAEVLVQTQSKALRLEGLLRAQAALENQAPDAVTQSVNAWKQNRDRLWARAQDILAQRGVGDAQALLGASQAFLRDLDVTQQTNQALVYEVQRAANQRSEAAQRRIRIQVVAALVLLLVLGLAVVEPAATRVRNQHRALSRQALRLKRLALVAERSSNAVLLADANRHVVWVNEAFVQLMGYGPEHAVGRRLSALLQASSVEPQSFAAFAVAARQGRGLKQEIKILAANDVRRWALVDLQPIFDDAGTLSGWVLIASDLTEARAQQQMLALAVEGAGLGTWQWDIQTGRLQCNTRMLEILGYQGRELEMTSAYWNQRVHPDDLGAWIDSANAHLANAALAHRMSIRVRHGSGRWVWLMMAGQVVDWSQDGRPLHMAGVAMDVQAQKAMEQQLRMAARTDGLTQLPNRSVVLDSIRAAILRRRAQPGYHFAVLFLDFDRFKQVNDTLGHAVGDELLRQIAQRLQDGLRPGDSLMHTSDFSHVAARIGGDEFVILLDDIRGDLDAEVVAGRLLDMLAVPYSIGPHKVSSTVSIGIVTSEHAADDADGVLRDADIAMYEAKHTGRARYVMFEPSMRQQVNASASLENDLRQALHKQELFVVYQPLVDLRSGVFTGMEALLRWRHPVRGLVSPVEFIPVAEDCGLIGALGQFVLQTACRAFAAMPPRTEDGLEVTLAVNLSRAQLRQPGLVAEVQDALRANGLAPRQLVLEVTESLAAQDAVVLETLHGLRNLGVRLSLDDFGTGYSSLSCLHELPVSFVKVDRSFVSQAQTSDYHRVLIEATIRMAQTLGLGTVAEGIETAGQAQLMARLGCDKGQGYLYGKPLEMPDLVAWVQARDVIRAASAASKM